MFEKKDKKVLLLTTGGTIAGWADDASQPLKYAAARLNGAQLLATLGVSGLALELEEVAQVDSKDMDEQVWRRLLERVVHALSDPQIEGIVITHGSDTAEETAFLLQAVLPPTKPIVLTCAMRPANAMDSDGASNVRDAIRCARQSDAAGVWLVCAGEVHAAHEVFKAHSTRLNAFSSGDLGPAGRVNAQGVSWLRPVNPPAQITDVKTVLNTTTWPRVELVVNHAQADGRWVRALLAWDKPAGCVVAGTGNGTISAALQEALSDAQRQGVRVMRTSRCAQGGVQEDGEAMFENLGSLSFPQARIALMLRLLQEKAQEAKA